MIFFFGAGRACVGEKLGISHVGKKGGGAGYRSLCLMHAKHALYHLSYTPITQNTCNERGQSHNVRRGALVFIPRSLVG